MTDPMPKRPSFLGSSQEDVPPTWRMATSAERTGMPVPSELVAGSVELCPWCGLRTSPSLLGADGTLVFYCLNSDCSWEWEREPS